MDIDVFMWFLIILLQSFLRINPGQEKNYHLFEGLLVSVKSPEILLLEERGVISPLKKKGKNKIIIEKERWTYRRRVARLLWGICLAGPVRP